MAYELPTTSLIGQEQAISSALGQSEGATVTIYGFGAPDRLGARQFLPLPETVKSSEDTLTFEQGGHSAVRPVPTRVLVPPAVRVASRDHAPILLTRQLWDGTVTEVRGKEFVARLSDRTIVSNPDEEATFDLDEISAEDRELVVPGSAFYWIIGTAITESGKRMNISMVQFRRLPAWTNRALSRAAQRAKHTGELFRASE